jgi:hypothetical protein
MLAVLLLALCAASPNPRPTSGAVRRAFEASKPSLVEVESPRGRSLGILLGSGGEVLTSLRTGQDQARVRWGGAAHPATVRSRRPELGVALLAIQSEGPFTAAAVHPGPPPQEGWVVAVERTQDGRAMPRLGKIRKAPHPDDAYVYIDLSVAAGTPVLDVKGRLLGWAVAKTAQGARLISIPALQAQLAEATPP